MMEISKLLKKMIAGQDLTDTESYDAITTMLKGELTEGQIGAFLAALASKGETVSEITGGARAMRKAATRIQALANDTLDTVGTGGDGGKTFNISTTVSFVAAGAGAVVAKHGNRASSGISGAADCLEKLGFQSTGRSGGYGRSYQRDRYMFSLCSLIPRCYAPLRTCPQADGSAHHFQHARSPCPTRPEQTRQLIGVFAPETDRNILPVLPRSWVPSGF